jgi:hypothetical protein
LVCGIEFIAEDGKEKAKQKLVQPGASLEIINTIPMPESACDKSNGILRSYLWKNKVKKNPPEFSADFL